jgi:ribonuclease Y
MQGQVEKRERDLERDQRTLDTMKRDYEDRLGEVDARIEEVNERLEQVSGMTADEAKEELLENLRAEVVVESAERRSEIPDGISYQIDNSGGA